MFPKGQDRQTESNEWCRPHNKTNLRTGMRKSSGCIREVALKGYTAVLVVCGNLKITMNREERLSSPQDEEYLVCCIGWSKTSFSN